MRRCDIAALLAAGAVIFAPARAVAHFVLQSPASWAEQDTQGNPQKTAPCGQADPQIAAVPTNATAAYRAGETITVSIDEVTFHPGHYRVVLSTTGQGGLPPDPETMVPGTCMGLAIEDPPVYPVLADGQLPHTDPFVGPQTFRVTVPKDVMCTDCTLQVLEFMQADVGASNNCFYHHCANISIAAAESDAGAADGSGGGTNDGGCACAVRESNVSFAPVLMLLGLVGLAWRRRRALFVMVPLIGIVAGGCGDDRSAADGFAVSPGDVEHRWLARVGTGAAQTVAACGRGAAIRSRARCARRRHRQWAGSAICTGCWASVRTTAVSRRWRRTRWDCRREPSPR